MMDRKTIKVFPTHEQIETIQEHGLRFEDVVIGPGDGNITVRDRWKLGENERWYVIERTGEFTIEYKKP